MVRSARARGKLARKASEGVKVAALSVAPKHKVASQQPMGGRPSKKSGSTTAVNSKVRDSFEACISKYHLLLVPEQPNGIEL